MTVFIVCGHRRWIRDQLGMQRINPDDRRIRWICCEEDVCKIFGIARGSPYYVSEWPRRSTYIQQVMRSRDFKEFETLDEIIQLLKESPP